jgi:hypothetical protein
MFSSLSESVRLTESRQPGEHPLEGQGAWLSSERSVAISLSSPVCPNGPRLSLRVPVEVVAVEVVEVTEPCLSVREVIIKVRTG